MIKEVLNVKHYKYFGLLLLFTLAFAGGSYAHCDNILTGSGYSSGTNEGYYISHYAFYDVCPHCGHHALEIGIKRHDEITCSYCDADYSFSGKEKTYSNPYYLTPYYPEPTPEPEPVIVVQQTPFETAKQLIQSHSIIG